MEQPVAISNTTYEANVKERNKNNNKEKIGFWNFLTYATKSELAIVKLYETLYWVGITECFLFFVTFILFLSKPRQLGWLLFCITHPIRSTLGFLVLNNLPKTQKIIENLKDIEHSTNEQIYQDIIHSYKAQMEPNIPTLQKLILFYWILTFINIIEDLILFISLFVTWGKVNYNFRNMTTLLILTIFFCKYFFLILIPSIGCNFSIVNWYGQMDMYFPQSTVGKFRQVIFTEVQNVKSVVESLRYKKTQNRSIDL